MRRSLTRRSAATTIRFRFRSSCAHSFRALFSIEVACESLNASCVLLLHQYARQVDLYHLVLRRPGSMIPRTRSSKGISSREEVGIRSEGVIPLAEAIPLAVAAVGHMAKGHRFLLLIPAVTMPQ